MPLKLNSAGGGSVTIDTPSTASNFNLTVPAATATVLTTASSASSIPGAFGVDQTWQNVGGSRSAGTTYTNSTGKPIMVCISQGDGSSVANNFYVNGNLIARQAIYNTGSNSNSYIIPNGATYMWELSSGVSFYLWWELR